MRLNNALFLWVLPAVLIPVAILGLIATLWSERRYLDDVDRALAANLANVVANVERRLLIERDIANGLAGVPAVQRFAAMLGALQRGDPETDVAAAFEEINRFLETFQSVRTSLETVRLLDRDGNTLVKVRSAQRVPATFGGLGDLPYVEEEPDDPRFTALLSGLRQNEVGSLLLTHRMASQGEGLEAAVYNTVMPLVVDGAVVGYLTIDPPLGPLNRVLAVLPRIHGAELVIAEVDSGLAAREGMILYDDSDKIDLWNLDGRQARLGTRYPVLYQALSRGAFGRVEEASGGRRLYYQEFLPYPDRLVTWVIALRVSGDELDAPFRNIRIGLLISVAATLLVSLAFATGVARGIGRPLLGLANGLAAFAGGARDTRVMPRGPDEIRAAGEAFNAMVETLATAERERDAARNAQYRSRRLASLGQMAAGIAHEISNPINTILSLTTLIERALPEDADAARADARSIREEAERAAETIRAIMSFSRQIGIDPRRFDAADWLRDSVALVEHECRACDAQIELTIIDDATLQGDPLLLQRALRNLLENAVQVTPPGGRVGVELVRIGGQIRVRVRDQGPGLDDEGLERAFDPFYTTKPEGLGSGLGLSISLGIAQHHGGDLTLCNGPGGGAEATLILPVAEPAVEPES